MPGANWNERPVYSPTSLTIAPYIVKSAASSTVTYSNPSVTVGHDLLQNVCAQHVNDGSICYIIVGIYGKLHPNRMYPSSLFLLSP